MNLLEEIKLLAKELHPAIIGFRNYLHANPELSFEEYNTAKYIVSVLKENNISFKERIAGTGVVAEIKGNNPSSKTIALRADTDALPIQELNNVPYKSKTDGVMHACGHDVHTASMLGAAIVLNKLNKHFSGTLRILFQPGEEKLPGGASLMIKEGVLENPIPNCIIAQHVFPSMETGKVGFRKGMYMASTDELFVTIRGKGGHAAMISEYNNPIFIASEIMLTLQHQFMNSESLLRRERIKDIPTVLAFGRFIANGATNVIPDEVKIEGTFRTMNEEWRKEAHQLMKNIAEDKAKELNGSCEFIIEKGYPFLINNEKVTETAIKAAKEYLGEDNVEELPLRMTGEDFAFYTQETAACFYRLGTGNIQKGITSGVHTATFDIDPAALETGAGLMAWIAVCQLNS